jgi:hypothetical protein
MATANTARAIGGSKARLGPAVAAGAIGGLIGGVVFGILMQMMDMMPMVAMLVGSKSVAVGWLVHLAISEFIGVSFAILLGRLATSVARSALFGMGYGAVWWVLGALILMPAKLGMSDMIFHVGKTQWQSLMGHLIYGLLLGLTFGMITRRLARRGQ